MAQSWRECVVIFRSDQACSTVDNGSENSPHAMILGEKVDLWAQAHLSGSF
jgi:hypothetical protein